MSADTPRAIALMTLAMACFAAADAAIKGTSEAMPSGQIIAIIGMGGWLGFALILARRGQPLFTAGLAHRAVIARNICEIVGTLGFITALTLAPLALVSAILQSSPLVVTAGAALILGEPTGLRRWAAIALGFGGVLVILRPDPSGITAGALLALVGAAGLAGRDLASRSVPAGISTMHISAWGFLVLAPAGLIFMAVAGQSPVLPDTGAAALMALAIVLAGVAIFAVTQAMRLGDVGTVAPFRYTRLVFGVALAMIFFGERPDATTWIGAAIVVASGLYVLARERSARHRR